jgi:hypothetical protein
MSGSRAAPRSWGNDLGVSAYMRNCLFAMNQNARCAFEIVVVVVLSFVSPLSHSTAAATIADASMLDTPIAKNCSNRTSTQILHSEIRLGDGNWYCYDLANDAMHHINTVCHSDGDKRVCDAREEEIPLRINNQFRQYRGIWLENDASEVFSRQIEVDIQRGADPNNDNEVLGARYISALDTMQDPSLDAQVTDYIGNLCLYDELFATALGKAASNSDVVFDGLRIRVVVIFKDHSRRDYEFSDVFGEFWAIEHTGRDAMGNQLRETRCASRHRCAPR